MERFFSDYDRYLFHHGTHYELYEKMGAHIREENGVRGVHFVLWAPSARAVCVVSDGNGWTPWRDVMEKTDDCMWELFVPGMCEGVKYKYLVVQADGREVYKIDPYGFGSELRPANASIVTNYNSYEWGDGEWRKARHGENFLAKPMAVYEVHLGSWKKDTWKSDEDRFLDYRRLAHELCEYVQYMGYTHVELMGICEYPFDPSWGYQVTGYFCPTARYGSPQDFMYFVDYMHKNGIGVILDWVPAHFPKDDFGLANFDGTPLYEYADPLRAEYPEWGTKAFDLGKKEVSNFLMASAFFWVNVYHVDALRADAVAAMFYNSFAREQWRPNQYGGNENLESFEFFRHLNSVLRSRTDAYIIAEDSSIIDGVTKPVKNGGFGFGMKWNMGWMNDTLQYIKKDPLFRPYHHWLMTHTLEYIFNENYMLVLSHDEVVYGKGVILDWVPAHFPKDDFGLANFDGTPLYEYADPLRAEYPEWGTKAFDLGKKEVSNFLMASAFFWVNVYHVDALRADAVAAMFYNSFAREQWRPNQYGGNENLESFEFFRHLNSVLRSRTDAYIIAEDSSIIDGVTKPVKNGGFGFGMKWNMGWMNDTLQYIKKDPLFRPYHHWLMTHTLEYIFNENYMLVLSHDEVVYGKGSMYEKMPGNRMDKFGELKTLYTMMMGHPGKKLLFMGQDFAQENEWYYKESLDWHLCDDPGHRDVMDCYRALLHIYTSHPVLYIDCGDSKTFEWINSGDFNRNIFSYIRRNPWNYNDALVFVCNFAPVDRWDMGVGAPLPGTYKRIFSTYPDGSPLEVEATEDLCNGRPYKLTFDLRPFESVIFEMPRVVDTKEDKRAEKEMQSRKDEDQAAAKAAHFSQPTRKEAEKAERKK